MNKRQDQNGYATNDHFLKSGFVIDRVHDFSTGWESWRLTDYSKDGKLFLTSGYWTYSIKNADGKILFEGWWNSNEEFDKTIYEIENNLPITGNEK